MKRTLYISAMAAVMIHAMFFSSCGSSTGNVGSSISLAITTPATTTDVSPVTQIVVTITDNDNVGLTVPSSWSDVLDLHLVGTTTNLCTNSNITYDTAVTPNTLTCSPDMLADGSQYALTISGLNDADGLRIDPASMAFQTGSL